MNKNVWLGLRCAVEKNLFFIEESFLDYILNVMQEHLIIDGNNAMHAIPSVMKELLRDRNFARTSLLSMLVPLVSGGNRVTVVFDGRAGKAHLRNMMEWMDLMCFIHPQVRELMEQLNEW